MSSKSKIQIGQIINVFRVLEDSGKRHSGSIVWLVECIYCGNKRKLDKYHMERNKSCGCQKNGIIKRANYKGYQLISGSYWNSIKKNASSRGLELSITKEYIWELYLKQSKRCALSGADIHFPEQFVHHDGTASLDRIDSSVGYIEGNVQWLHKDVNFMKQQFSEERFIEWCKKISIYNDRLYNG